MQEISGALTSMLRPFTETITSHSHPGWPESSDESDPTAMVRQRSARVSATHTQIWIVTDLHEQSC